MTGNAVDLIRSRPAMFFGTGEPSMTELIAAVVKDACVLSKAKIEVLRDDPWAIVCADFDWLNSSKAKFHELFERFVLPEYRVPNCHRSEILIVAAAKRLLTFGPAGNFEFAMSMDDVPSAIAIQAKTATRAMIWEFGAR